jgi:hypothetical protein
MRIWPGDEPDLVCADHAADSQRVAEAMGFHCHCDPAGYKMSEIPPDELPMCCYTRDLSQTVVI